MQLSFIQFIKQLPFVRLIIPFIVGIIIQINFSINLKLVPYFIFISLIILIIIELIKLNKKKFKYRFISGIFVYILLILSGAYLVKTNTPSDFKNIGKEIICKAIILEPPSEKAKSFKTFAKLEYYYLNDSILKSNNKVVIYFEKDSFSAKLNYGDKIVFKSRINEIKLAGNPYEFNYKDFLFNKGIVAQTYITKDSWKRINADEGWLIFHFAYKIRNTFSNIYKSYSIKGQEFAVLQALTLGDKSEIDKDTRQSYVASGAMHILAVSGLHVGIIYMILNFFLGFLDKFKTKKWNIGSFIKAVILIVLLWSFALVSGLSPSVRRAALMFTIVIIGRAIKNKVSIYNSISASAFILLLIDPYQIMNVGFQLSYAAVISIVHFQPKIVKLFVIKNKILYYFWSLTAVSIAAQIGTAPISLYYFHVFPNYFMLANIIVIPFAFAIVLGAFALLATSWIPYLSTFIAFLLKWIIKILNFSVSFIEQLPFSSTKEISFNNYDVLFLGIIIILIAVFFTFKQPKSLIQIFAILLIWIGISTFFKISINSNKQLFVYNIKDKTAINIIGKENILLADSSIFEDESIKYGPLSNWMHLNKTDYSFLDVSEKNYSSNFMNTTGKYFECNSKKFLILNDKKQLKFQSDNKLSIDYIIVSGNNYLTINDILNLYDVKTIIFDSSNDFYKLKKWKQECAELKQHYYSVSESGVFEVLL